MNGVPIGTVNMDGTLRDGYITVNDESSEQYMRKSDLDGMNIHVASIQTSAAVNNTMRYKDIYIHSKLTLIDDIFYTLGSANINTRSMEADTELNIACPSPETTKKLRKHLWGIHTKQTPSDDMRIEFERWAKVMMQNHKNKRKKMQLVAPLVEFFDDGDTAAVLD